MWKAAQKSATIGRHMSSFDSGYVRTITFGVKRKRDADALDDIFDELWDSSAIIGGGSSSKPGGGSSSKSDQSNEISAGEVVLLQYTQLCRAFVCRETYLTVTK